MQKQGLLEHNVFTTVKVKSQLENSLIIETKEQWILK